MPLIAPCLSEDKNAAYRLGREGPMGACERIVTSCAFAEHKSSQVSTLLHARRAGWGREWELRLGACTRLRFAMRNRRVVSFGLFSDRYYKSVDSHDEVVQQS